MQEQHPFGYFFPDDMRFLITGTFPGRQFSQRSQAENEADTLAFSYGGRNHLWKILSIIYDVSLVTRADKKAFLSKNQFGMLDLYATVTRRKASNLDTDLKVVATNQAIFTQLLESNSVEKIFCTGIGVANELRKWLPSHADKIIALPSPSPAYRGMSLAAKIEAFRDILEKLQYPPKNEQ